MECCWCWDSRCWGCCSTDYRQRFQGNVEIRVALELVDGAGGLRWLLPVYNGGDALLLAVSVSNKKQPITTGESTHVGQHNIAERYRLLTNKKVEILETADDYCVTIPLI